MPVRLRGRHHLGHHEAERPAPPHARCLARRGALRLPGERPVRRWDPALRIGRFGTERDGPCRTGIPPL